MHSLKINLIACFLILFAVSAYSQGDAGIDSTYTPEITTQDFILSPDSPAPSILLQPDGKLLVFNGKIPNRIVRLNADGSRDTSFSCSICRSISLGIITLQSDGKILVAGKDSATNLPKIIRVNADGSLDVSFSNALIPTTGFSGSLIVYGTQSDGKIYVGLKQSSAGSSNTTIYRLNADGSVDNSFTPIVHDTTSSAPINLKILTDGRVFIYGRTAYGFIAQLNDDGSKNTSFESPSLTGPVVAAYVMDITLQANGKIAFSGYFSTVNGVGRRMVARLNSDGSVDTQFVFSMLFPPFESDRAIQTIDAVPNNKLLVGSDYTIKKITRLNSDGTIDNTYTPPASISGFVNLIVDDIGRAYVLYGFNSLKLVRLNTDGTLDSSYVPNTGAVGSVDTLALQPDGKTIVAGNFSNVNNVPRDSIARLNADGSTDTSFNAGSGLNSQIRDIAVQTNGKIIIGGQFTNINGANRPNAARLNSDGSLDTSFSPIVTSSVNAVALQSDGKILIGGEFSSLINNVSYISIMRFNADGSFDSSFNPKFPGGTRIYDILAQSDGKIMVQGEFNGVNGVNRTNLVRLNSDGTVDTSFNANSFSTQRQIIQQPDGKYLIRLTTVVLRLNSNGSLDNDFVYTDPQGNSPELYTISLQPNGAIIVGGRFEFINGYPQKNIVRLLPNGRVDVSYSPKKADYPVRASVTQSDGKVVVGGDFTSIGDVLRSGVARLLQSPIAVPPTNFDFDGDGKADISLFRPSSGTWYLQRSLSGFTAVQFGDMNDKLAVADYDGDGKSDLAVYRNGTWYLQRSTAGFIGLQFGEATDIPQPADYDGDGKADLAVFRPSNGIWYIYNLANNQTSAVQFGQNGDKPVAADYDGDGKADYAIFRTNTWYLLRSNLGFTSLQFGLADDKLVPADYDGDGKADIAVFRPSNGNWYINRSQSGLTGLQWGGTGDLPVPADYNGDGRAELAVYRPTNGTWYLYSLTSNQPSYVNFGQTNDKPVPNAYIP